MFSLISCFPTKDLINAACKFICDEKKGLEWSIFNKFCMQPTKINEYKIEKVPKCKCINRRIIVTQIKVFLLIENGFDLEFVAHTKNCTPRTAISQ